MNKNLTFVLLGTLFLAGCGKEPIIETRHINGKTIFYDIANDELFSGEHKKTDIGEKGKFDREIITVKDGQAVRSETFYDQDKPKEVIDYKNGFPE